jgi:hypothetical protein
MIAVPFTRPTIIAAVALIDRSLSQASFNHLVLRLGLENDITSNTNISVSKKADVLGRIVVQHPARQVDTLEGSLSLAEAVVREAVQLTRPEPVHEVETAFIRGLARDGYVVSFEVNRQPSLRAALPEELGLPAVDDEVHELLKHFAFSESRGHLDQGIETHARGDWAAANAQFRTFLEGLLDAIAYHEGAVKKLRDEVVPVLHHVRFVKAKGDIRFELNDGVPDCWLRDNLNAPPQGLEVTVAQSREQHRLGQEMNETGIAPGFLGLPDDASEKVFKERLMRARVMYSSEGALKVIGNGIKDCLCKKDHPKYTGHDLLIEAPLHSLPKERWSRIEDDLRSAAGTLPFREIHIIGDHDTSPFGFRIK